MLAFSVNGLPQTLPEPCPLDRALALWGFKGAAFAVAVNGDFVPKSQYAQRQLSGGELIDILSPMQGG